MSAVIQAPSASGVCSFAQGWKWFPNSSEDAPENNSSPLIQIWSSASLSSFHTCWCEQAELNGWELRVRPGWQITFNTSSFPTDTSAPANERKKIWTRDRHLGGTRRTCPSTLFSDDFLCFMHKCPWNSCSFSWYDLRITPLCLVYMHMWNLIVLIYGVHEPSLPAPSS